MKEMLDEMAAHVKEAFAGNPGKFRPCAFFDDRLDCIRVIARDCSVLETRVNPAITVLEDNYAESKDKRYVGFTIKGARHFCKEHNFDLSAPIEMSALLDAILTGFPEFAVDVFINFVARPLVEKEKIKKVDVPRGVLQPV
jgi:hypothetical protein